jgi:hypothetical protein
MEIKLVFVDLFKMLVNVVEVLEGKPKVVLTKVRKTCFNLIPHALHIMNIKFFTAILAKESHCFLCFLELIDADLVP